MAYDLLRIAVSRICGADPASLTIGRTEHGKPFFVERRDIHFSISHAGEYILIAIGSEPLGVDIEQRRVISYEKIGRRIMTDPEYEAFLEREDREAEFYRKWGTDGACSSISTGGISRRSGRNFRQRSF